MLPLALVNLAHLQIFAGKFDAAAALMDQADAIALAAQFGQEAIFVLTPADRQVAGCTQRRVVTTGWSIEPEADAPATTGATRA